MITFMGLPVSRLPEFKDGIHCIDHLYDPVKKSVISPCYIWVERSAIVAYGPNSTTKFWDESWDN